MDIFFTLVTNLIPLYVLIAVGFFAGRFFSIDRETLANLAVFILMPVVVFGFVAQLELKPAYILLPVFYYGVQAVIALSMLKLGHFIYGDARANVLAMCSSMGNSGYFGLPLVLLLFEQQWVGVYMFMLLGFVIFEGTIGYYIAARGKFSVRESFIKLAKFPSIYAVTAGLLVNFMHLEMPGLFITYWTYFKGAYVIIGMMIIGAALSRVKKLVFAPRFLGLVFLGKFVAWPLLCFAFVAFDRAVTHLFAPEVLNLVLVGALVPPAANIAAFAAQFDIKPEKAATTVLVGTVFALLYIPLMLALFGI